MPIYEFSCGRCGHRFDVFGGYGSRDVTQICPQCEGTHTRALISTFAVGGRSAEAAPAPASPQAGGGCGGCAGGCACAN